MTMTPTNAMYLLRMFDLRSFFEWLLAPLSVHQFLDKFHTLEIEKLCILFLPPVERHADLPRTREDLGIFNCGLVRNHVRACARISFDDVQLVTMEITRSIEPGFIIKSGHVDHERFSFPVGHGLSHPGVHWRRARIFQIKVANSAVVLIRNRDGTATLHDLKRIWHV